MTYDLLKGLIVACSRPACSRSIRQDNLLLLAVDAFADAEDVAVGVADVEFADLPGFVGGRHCDLDVVG